MILHYYNINITRELSLFSLTDDVTSPRLYFVVVFSVLLMQQIFCLETSVSELMLIIAASLKRKKHSHYVWGKQTRKHDEWLMGSMELFMYLWMITCLISICLTLLLRI